MANIHIDFGILESELRQYANSVCRNAASEIADDLTEEARLAINTFYSDYSPMYYKRHFTNFENNSYKRYYSNPHNKIFSGGVEFTPDAMLDIYQHPVSKVFGSVIESGSHGPELYTNIKPMSPSPMRMVKIRRDNIVDNIQQYIDRAKSKSRSGQYTILRFN